MIVTRGFKYRIYPTEAQVERLCRWEGALRFLWNIALDQRLFAYGRSAGDRKYPSAFDQALELTDLRAMLPWLSDVPRNVCAQVLVELDLAWQRCFKRIAGTPRFKRKGRDLAPMIEPHPRCFRVEGQTVVLPKLGVVSAVIHRPLSGTPKRCAIVRDGDQWFASILCEMEVADPAPSILPPVGIDRGVVNVVADSDGRIIPNQRHAEKLQPRIRRAQRTVARRKKGSKNQQKARARVARLQRKARRQREHHLHVESHHYAKNHGAVIVEVLKVKSMTRSARGTVEEPGVNVAAKAGLNRSIMGAGWGRFVEMLKYKVVPAGGRVVEVNPAYTSQTCSACGHVAAENRPSQSAFRCVACGHEAHADVNAAKVILARGLNALAVESTVTVCGGTAARERPTKQKLCVARRGTRRETEACVQTTKVPAFMPR